MARPRIEVLDKNEVLEIHWRTLSVLSRVGVKVDHAEALKLLHSIGAEVDFNRKIAKIPEHIVKEALAKTPSSIRLYHRDGKQFIELMRWSTYFDVGSAGLYYIDWRTGEVRRALTRDLAEVARVTNALPNIHLMSTALVPSDVPDIIADRWRMCVDLKNCTKPIDTGAFTLEGIPDAVKIMASILGEDNVSKKPIMMFATCPSSPLMWSDLTTQNLMDCAKYRVPVHIVSAPQTSATSPATIAGTNVQVNAEILAGLVIAQFTRPGTPVIYGVSPTVFDQRYGTACLGSIEVGLMCATFTQLARFYGIPSAGYIMVSDAKTADSQASLESAFGALIAVLSGTNIAIGAGMLLEENGISLVKLVIDNDIAGLALRFGRGVLVDVETLAEKIIEEVGPGGLFLKYKHSREWWRKEHFLPTLLDKKLLICGRKAVPKTLQQLLKSMSRRY